MYTGKSAILRVFKYLAAMLEKEDRRALIITDSFTKKFVKKIDEHMDDINMEYKVWSEVLPEAPVSTIAEGVKTCESFHPKVIIAIGGGSVMDTAKMIMVKYEKPDQNLFMIMPSIGGPLGLRKKIKSLVFIPTTAGTGSEVSQDATITDDSRIPPKKIEVVHDELLADITILDTDFVKDLPPFFTMATGLDAFSHAMGAYTTNWGNPYFDAINLTVIKEIVKYLPRCYKYGGNDIEARNHMQLASSFAAFGAYGNQTPGLNHAFGHSFGKLFDVHHGISCAIFLLYTIPFKAKVTDRWKQLCPIFGVTIENKSRTELLFDLIQKIKAFMHSIDGPTSIKELETPIIKKEEFIEKMDKLVDYASNDAVGLTSFRPINNALFRKVFEYAYEGKFIDF
jgi:alcohol dehydrogenase class IV